MSPTVREREMISVKEEFDSKFVKEDNKDDQHNLLSNMVDARACYKPSERVRKNKYTIENHLIHLYLFTIT